MSKLEAALALAARGFKVFPIAPGGKAPPLLNDWPNKATSDEGTIRGWWGGIFPADANIGVSAEGYVVLDVDVKKGGDDALAYLDAAYGIPATLTTRTPTGGRHLYFRLPTGHPGVANSVSVVGEGIDVRSNGGYLVGAGSAVSAGNYAAEGASDLVGAPDWLVHKLGTSTPRVQTEKVDVPDAEPGVVARARTWLKTQQEAIEGQGGDACTFTIACGLRDRGVSAQQALYLLLNHWNDRCLPPWSPDDLQTKVENAYRYAQNEPGGQVARAEDFPIIKPTEDDSNVVQDEANTARSGANSEVVYRIADAERRRDGRADYIAKGVLYRKSYANLFGAPGEGKTFVALDMCYHIAAGQEWSGRKVRGGTVVYVPFEGKGGLVDRLCALRRKYGDGDVPFFIAENPAFNLRTEEGRKAFGRLLSKLPVKPSLIAFDTFAYALSGGDENSAQDVGAFNSAVAALIESTGACVMVVHHTGKNKTAGARGSSALNAAVDTEIFVDNGTITVTKQRDAAIIDPIGFKLVPVVVGLDEDGEEITSCVVEPDAVAACPAGRLTGNSKRGFDVLCELRPDNRPVADGEWREACAQFLGNKSLSQRFYDIKKSLKAKGYVLVDEQGMVTRRMT